MFRKHHPSPGIEVDGGEAGLFPEGHLLVVAEVGQPPLAGLVAKDISAAAARRAFMPIPIWATQLVRGGEPEGIPPLYKVAATEIVAAVGFEQGGPLEADPRSARWSGPFRAGWQRGHVVFDRLPVTGETAEVALDFADLGGRTIGKVDATVIASSPYFCFT